MEASSSLGEQSTPCRFDIDSGGFIHSLFSRTLVSSGRLEKGYATLIDTIELSCTLESQIVSRRLSRSLFTLVRLDDH